MEIYIFIIHKAFFKNPRILSFFLRSFFIGDSPVSVTQKGGCKEVVMKREERLVITAQE